MISILMSFRNEAAFLAECLESILKQTERNWELIAVDDHSTDNSLNILESYAQKDSRIRSFKNKDKGIIPALLLAFDNSNGEWITRMDADDIMPPNKLKLLKERIQTLRQKNIVTGNVQYFSNGKLQEGFQKYAAWLNELNSSQNHFESIYKECVIASPAWMARKKDLIEINAFNQAEYPEDYDLVFRWYKHGFKISAVPAIIHYWRDHPDRASRNDPHYQDNLFAKLKIHYFLDIDSDNLKKLVLWGAGRKAKSIARALLNHHQDFLWLTNNEKKIGKNIYGIILNSTDEMPDSNRQVIIAISDQQFQLEKEKMFKKFNLYEEERFEFT